MQKRYGSKRRAKEELFARYASFIYLGNGRYGFAAATQYYFGIPMTALTEDDADKAALLAAIPKSPSEYAPTLAGNEKPLRRRNQILALMVKNHFLSAQTAERCERAPIYLAAHVSAPTEAPAAVGSVLDELKGLDATLAPDIGISQLLEGHIQVYSTINGQIQNFANAALENELTLYERRHPQSKGLVQGSVVVLRNSDSAILAEVGGRRIYKSQNATYSDYNRVTQSMRQPGSAMKPIVYLAAFRQGDSRSQYSRVRRTHFGSGLRAVTFRSGSLISIINLRASSQPGKLWLSRGTRQPFGLFNRLGLILFWIQPAISVSILHCTAMTARHSAHPMSPCSNSRMLTASWLAVYMRTLT